MKYNKDYNYDLSEIMLILFMGAGGISFLALTAFIIVNIYMLCTTGSVSM